jgi:endonuclease/exonuclease/phosphatase family metal-dependent hydrolase
MEQYAHYDEVVRAIDEHDFDVVCLQEVPEHILPKLAARFFSHIFFSPMVDECKKGRMGLGILLRRGSWRRCATVPYYQVKKSARNSSPSYSNCNRILQYAIIVKGGVEYVIGQTHFTWTPTGEPSARQYKDMRVLLNILDTLPPMVLCGDFNAPRGLPVWGMLAERFCDNIPIEETTTLDQKYHRAAPIHHVVDGMFTPSSYVVKEIALVSGVSDHKLITAKILRVL